MSVSDQSSDKNHVSYVLPRFTGSSPAGFTARAGSSVFRGTIKTSEYGLQGPLRANAKSLPGHIRERNRALVLQSLYRQGPRSRADLSRETGLTRVTISDLVSELISKNLIVEQGPQQGVRPGKPATLIDINRAGWQVICMDLSDSLSFTGVVTNLNGDILTRLETPIEGVVGGEAMEKVTQLACDLLSQATQRILGVGVGSPGIVDLSGTVVSAPNLGWTNHPLQAKLNEFTGHPVAVANDANTAALAEYSFGGANTDMLLLRIGRGVGAGLVLGGSLLFGSRYAAGELGHVVVGTDGGQECVCGKYGCLETWLSRPSLEARLHGLESADQQDVLEEAGRRLGIALAPVISALDLSEVVLSGPRDLVDGPLANAAAKTLTSRTAAEFQGRTRLRMSELGQEIVTRGAAALVLSSRLGVS